MCSAVWWLIAILWASLHQIVYRRIQLHVDSRYSKHVEFIKLFSFQHIIFANPIHIHWQTNWSAQIDRHGIFIATSFSFSRSLTSFQAYKFRSCNIIAYNQYSLPMRVRKYNKVLQLHVGLVSSFGNDVVRVYIYINIYNIHMKILK